MELLVPKGLPQAMQWKGSSSFSTRSGAFHALKSRRGSSVMTFSGQVDWQSPHCTHRLSVKRSIARSGLSDSAPVGQAVTQAWHSVQPSTFSFTPPKGAPGANGTTSAGADAARWSSRNVVSSTLRFAPRGTKPAGFCVATPTGAASSMTRNWSGSSVSMMRTRPAPKPSAETMLSVISTAWRSAEMSCRGLARVTIAAPLPP